MQLEINYEPLQIISFAYTHSDTTTYVRVLSFDPSSSSQGTAARDPLGSAREGSDLDALVAERGHGCVVGAEEAVGRDEGEEDVADDGAEGDGHRRPGLPAEAAEHAARLAPRHLLVAVVRQVEQLCRRRAGRQDQVREHLHPFTHLAG